VNKKIIILLFLIATCAGIIFYNPGNLYAPSVSPTPLSSSTLSINNKTVEIEIADTPAETQQGLSDRKSLGSDNGMLFVFPTEQIPSFWMKDMHFAIDIIWINKDWKIIDITQNLKPDTYPQAFSPRQEVKYVLEVNAGWSKKNNIAIGDSVAINQ
jgi:uncharacterized protein